MSKSVNRSIGLILVIAVLVANFLPADATYDAQLSESLYSKLTHSYLFNASMNPAEMLLDIVGYAHGTILNGEWRTGTEPDAGDEIHFYGNNAYQEVTLPSNVLSSSSTLAVCVKQHSTYSGFIGSNYWGVDRAIFGSVNSMLLGDGTWGEYSLADGISNEELYSGNLLCTFYMRGPNGGMNFGDYRVCTLERKSGIITESCGAIKNKVPDFRSLPYIGLGGFWTTSGEQPSNWNGEILLIQGFNEPLAQSEREYLTKNLNWFEPKFVSYYTQEEIDEKLAALDQKLSDRISLLEQWKSAFDATFSSIQNAIASISSRLSLLEANSSNPIGCAYDNPSCIAGYLCMNNICVCTENWSCSAWTICQNSTKIRTCIDLNACGTIVNKPTLNQSCSSQCTENWQCTNWTSCSSNSTQVRSCIDSNNCGTIASRPVINQSCTYSAKKVIFRTNVASGSYASQLGSWVAADCDNDGILTGYGRSGQTTTSQMISPRGKTPEGYDYKCYSGNSVIYIKTGQSTQVVYKTSVQPSGPPELSLFPTEPYAGNNQEVYK